MSGRVRVSCLVLSALLTCVRGVDKIPDLHEMGPRDEERLNDDIVSAATVLPTSKPKRGRKPVVAAKLPGRRLIKIGTRMKKTAPIRAPAQMPPAARAPTPDLPSDDD